jgi:hypothetical protein
VYDPGQLYVDPYLTNFAFGWGQQNLYGAELAPINRVNVRSGKYRVFDRSNWIIFKDRREPGAVANEVRGRKWSEDSFFVKEHSLQSPIHDEERDNYNALGGLATADAGAGLDIAPEEDATELILGSIARGHEKNVADKARNTANYAGGHSVTLAGAQQWDDYTGGEASTSNPVNDLLVGLRKVVNTLKLNANDQRARIKIFLPFEGLSYIENHPRVIARFKNFSLMEENAVAKLLGFPGDFVLTDSVYNSANNIDATEAITSFWGKDVIIAVVDERDGSDIRTFMKTFAWPYQSGDVTPVDKWREEGRKSDIVRASMRYDTKIVSNQAGYVIKTAWSAGAF